MCRNKFNATRKFNKASFAAHAEATQCHSPVNHEDEDIAGASGAGGTNGSSAAIGARGTNVASFLPFTPEPKWQDPKLGLSRISYILARLDNPQDKVCAIHIAGTNGKGSTSAFVTSILQAAGYKTGAFTSPHIMEFSDRIRINGQNLPAQALAAMKVKIAGIIAEMNDIPTEFEVATAMAFAHFAAKNCDFMVIEVGLGGQLDSTNVIARPEICAVTPVAIDHSNILGSDLAQIAAQKAGIIKSGTTVVCGVQTDVAMEVISTCAQRTNCEIFYTDASKLSLNEIVKNSNGNWTRKFSYKQFENLETSLLGTYQTENAATAIEIIVALQNRGWRIPTRAVSEGIKKATWPGRFEIISGNKNTPTYILDGGHNTQGAQALVESLNDVFHGKRIVLATSVMKDKDYRDMLEALLPACNSFVAYEFDFPRVLDCEVLAKTAKDISAETEVVTAANVQDAKAAAEKLAGPEDIICVCGSLYALSDWYNLLRLR